MFELQKISGKVEDALIENKTQSSNLIFDIGDKNFTLRFMQTKIASEGDMVKLLCFKTLFNKYEVLTVRNLTKNKGDYPSRMLEIVRAIILFMFLPGIAFILSCFIENTIAKMILILPSLPLFMLAVYLIKATIFMKNNKEWLLKED